MNRGIWDLTQQSNIIIMFICTMNIIIYNLLLGEAHHLMQKVIQPDEFAYLSKRGTTDVVVSVSRLYIRELDNPTTKCIYVLFNDFSKAFD